MSTPKTLESLLDLNTENTEDILDLDDGEIEIKETRNTDIVISNNQAVTVQPPVSDDIDSDFKTGQDTLTKTIQKGNEMLDSLVGLAEESQQPRAFEAATKLIEAIGKNVQIKADLHLKRQQIKSNEKSGSPIYPPIYSPNGVPQANGAIGTQNNVFVGTTKDLLEIIKQQQNEMRDVINSTTVIDVECEETRNPVGLKTSD